VSVFDQLNTMSAFVEYAEHQEDSVSGWTVGQQIEHCCLTMRAVGEALSRTSDLPGRTKLTIVARRIFKAGSIPRGRAKAPTQVQPGTTPSPEDLRRSIEKARAAVAVIDPDDEAGTFEHPYFGSLNREQAIRFIELHNAHHLAIVEDILGAKTG
jgi:hypothetical protein